MNSISRRVSKLEQALTDPRELGRLVQVMGSRNFSDEELKAWLQGCGIVLLPDDRIQYHCLVGIEPGTMRPVYAGEMGRITIFDPAANEREVYEVAQ